jgi:hypothetical protein
MPDAKACSLFAEATPFAGTIRAVHSEANLRLPARIPEMTAAAGYAIERYEQIHPG